MKREDFMQGYKYMANLEGKSCFPNPCSWKLAECQMDDWDGYECQECGARFTEKCSFEDEFK